MKVIGHKYDLHTGTKIRVQFDRTSNFGTTATLPQMEKKRQRRTVLFPQNKREKKK